MQRGSKMQLLLAVLVFSGALASARGQSACALSEIHKSGVLIYPRIAQFAHIQGDVVMAANFNTNGQPTHVDIHSGPPMLQQVSQSYVANWHVNATRESQDCEIRISFRISGDEQCNFADSVVTMTDLRNFIVTVRPVATCEDIVTKDPAYYVHHFLFLRWKTRPKAVAHG